MGAWQQTQGGVARRQQKSFIVGYPVVGLEGKRTNTAQAPCANVAHSIFVVKSRLREFYIEPKCRLERIKPY
jgi:hypothetical protein